MTLPADSEMRKNVCEELSTRRVNNYEEDGTSEDEVAKLCRVYLLIDLKRMCAERCLKVSGVKRDFTTRILSSNSSEEKPTKKRLTYLARLLIGMKPDARSLVKRRKASKRIQELKAEVEALE